MTTSSRSEMPDVSSYKGDGETRPVRWVRENELQLIHRPLTSEFVDRAATGPIRCILQSQYFLPAIPIFPQAREQRTEAYMTFEWREALIH